jgi:hypothetical protein
VIARSPTPPSASATTRCSCSTSSVMSSGRPAIRQRAQRRWLARGAGAGGHPLPGDREAPVIRGDAAFANPEIYEFLEAEGIGYTIRLPANTVLQNRIGHLLKRPIGRPPHEARRYFASFSYQAQSWKKSRRVVAKVEWHPNELYPRVGFIVTNLARPAEHVVAFYNQRGTAEQWIKEGKGAIKCTRLSCRTFAANAVRLQLHALAYNLGYFMRTLALPETTGAVVADQPAREADQDRRRLSATVATSLSSWPRCRCRDRCSRKSCR